MKLSKVILFIVGVVFLISCSSTNEAESNFLSIIADEDFHYFGISSPINLTVENLSDKPVYYLCTGTVYLEELSDGYVTNLWKVHGFEECLGKVPIQPKDVKSFRISFKPSGMLFKFQGANFTHEFKYRLRPELFYDRDLLQPIEKELLISNEFYVIKYD